MAYSRLNVNIFRYKVVEKLSCRFPAEGFARTLVEEFLIEDEVLIENQGKICAFCLDSGGCKRFCFRRPRVIRGSCDGKKDLEA